MKTLLIVFAIAMLAGRSFADIAPDALGAPIFQIYSITQSSGQPIPQFTVNTQHALLTVTSLSDLELAQDMMAVQVDLNANDTKKLAGITRKYSLLAFVGGDKKTAAYVKVSAPIDDGRVLFSDAHNSGAMAAYLRQAFHIKPNSNQATVPPAQVKPSAAESAST